MICFDFFCRVDLLPDATKALTGRIWRVQFPAAKIPEVSEGPRRQLFRSEVRRVSADFS